MGKINQLSPHVANLIAAGEVVERPASVVKELLENSIDAGAKHVTVEIQNGGMTFLRLSDDGCGMSPEDAQIAFLRHATSKIKEKTDLDAIGTLGFRGEALAAISSVSRIDLLTRSADAPLGVSLHLEAGKIISCDEAGCPEGTTIIVRDLFYNTPARMKFMKRDSVEGAAVFASVQKQAVAHPEVAIRFLRDGKEELTTSGDGQLLSAIYSVYGRQTAMDMVEMNSKWEKTQVSGYISKPTAARGNRNYQIFFVNGRYVKSSLLSAALEEAYRNQIMVGRFPTCVLELSMPLGLVDVNIHPAKTEVKFLNERDVYDCVYYGTLSVLSRLSGQVNAKLQTPAAKIEQDRQPEAIPISVKKPAIPKKKDDSFFRSMSAEEFRTEIMAPHTSGNAGPVKAAKKYVTPTSAQPKKDAIKNTIKYESARIFAPNIEVDKEEPEQTSMELPEIQKWRIIGECFDTYILIEQEEALCLVDKHAAHERILFEKLRAQQTPIVPQKLLKPLACQLASEEAALILENKEMLSNCGFIVEEYDGGAVLLREIPSEIDALDAQESLSQLAQQIQNGRYARPEDMRDEILHTIACKAAIKAGYHTNPIEREALVREVMTRDDLKYCPHGRPICIRLTKKQIEHQFGRT